MDMVCVDTHGAVCNMRMIGGESRSLSELAYAVVLNTFFAKGARERERERERELFFCPGQRATPRPFAVREHGRLQQAYVRFWQRRPEIELCREQVCKCAPNAVTYALGSHVLAYAHFFVSGIDIIDSSVVSSALVHSWCN